MTSLIVIKSWNYWNKVIKWKKRLSAWLAIDIGWIPPVSSSLATWFRRSIFISFSLKTTVLIICLMWCLDYSAHGQLGLGQLGPVRDSSAQVSRQLGPGVETARPNDKLYLLYITQVSIQLGPMINDMMALRVVNYNYTVLSWAITGKWNVFVP